MIQLLRKIKCILGMHTGPENEIRFLDNHGNTIRLRWYSCFYCDEVSPIKIKNLSESCKWKPNK